MVRIAHVGYTMFLSIWTSGSALQSWLCYNAQDSGLSGVGYPCEESGQPVSKLHMVSVQLLYTLHNESAVNTAIRCKYNGPGENRYHSAERYFLM